MNNEFIVRLITAADAAEVLRVYTPYVLETANTFEYEVPSVEEFTKRIVNITTQYPWLVCEYKGTIVGYVYGSPHRLRTAYQWSLETTVYIDAAYHRMGLARIMYDALFAMLKLQGYYSVFVSILITNEGSVGFHKSFGFEEIGHFKNIGYKLGQWHTNNWMQYFLQEHITDPAMPVPVTQLQDTDTFKSILAKANERLNDHALKLN